MDSLSNGSSHVACSLTTDVSTAPADVAATIAAATELPFVSDGGLAMPSAAECIAVTVDVEATPLPATFATPLLADASSAHSSSPSPAKKKRAKGGNAEEKKKKKEQSLDALRAEVAAQERLVAVLEEQKIARDAQMAALREAFATVARRAAAARRGDEGDAAASDEAPPTKGFLGGEGSPKEAASSDGRSPSAANGNSVEEGAVDVAGAEGRQHADLPAAGVALGTEGGSPSRSSTGAPATIGGGVGAEGAVASLVSALSAYVVGREGDLAARERMGCGALAHAIPPTTAAGDASPVTAAEAAAEGEDVVISGAAFSSATSAGPHRHTDPLAVVGFGLNIGFGVGDANDGATDAEERRRLRIEEEAVRNERRALRAERRATKDRQRAAKKKKRKSSSCSNVGNAMGAAVGNDTVVPPSAAELGEAARHAAAPSPLDDSDDSEGDASSSSSSRSSSCAAYEDDFEDEEPSGGGCGGCEGAAGCGSCGTAADVEERTRAEVIARLLDDYAKEASEGGTA